MKNNKNRKVYNKKRYTFRSRFKKCWSCCITYNCKYFWWCLD